MSTRKIKQATVPESPATSRFSELLADLSKQKDAALTIWLKGEADLKRVRQRQRGLWQRYANIGKKIQRLKWSKVG